MHIHDYNLEALVKAHEDGIEFCRVEDDLDNQKVCIRYGLANFNYSDYMLRFKFYASFKGRDICLYIPNRIFKKSDKYKEFNQKI